MNTALDPAMPATGPAPEHPSADAPRLADLRKHLTMANMCRQLTSVNFYLQFIGAFFGLYGQWLVGAHSANGFACWVISNTALIALQLRTRLLVLVGLHSVYLALSVNSYLDWSR